MGANTKELAPVEVLPVSRDAILAQFGQMVFALPDREPDDGTGIVAGILQATSWEQLNTEGKLPDAETQIGRRLWLMSVGKAVSDIEDGEPFYLIIDAVDKDTGEQLTWQTSSKTIMAQIVKAFHSGMWPMLATVTKAEKPTKAGFYPLQLKVMAVDPDRA